MKKIFVGNLSWKVTEEILRPLFEEFGPVVSVKIISDHYTGKSRGFGFVEMDSADAATKAIEGLNDKAVLDRNIRVSLAQDRPAPTRNGTGQRRDDRFGGNRGERGERGERGGRRPSHQSSWDHS